MKNNKYLFITLFCFIPFLGQGQQKIQALEFEIGGGYSIAKKSNKKMDAFQFFLEIRNNLPNSKFDFGIQFCLGKTPGIDQVIGVNPSQYEDLTRKKHESGIYLLPVVDYNFKQGDKVSYFVGSSLGLMISSVNNNGSVCVMPRVGIEIYNQFRFTLDYKWNWKGVYNYTGINVGFVFGGKPLKKK